MQSGLDPPVEGLSLVVSITMESNGHVKIIIPATEVLIFFNDRFITNVTEFETKKLVDKNKSKIDMKQQTKVIMLTKTFYRELSPVDACDNSSRLFLF